ncbi:FMN-binding glutamate synthase family protein [Methylophaga sp. 42_25_T18]|nr:FMN-binding glutamate synthase family protein [Methylophaga sp. 42_25_T18]OUR85820.1 FMN-binding glutamate synthase family protein [Methylophaga sp. 42_8_T64]
MEELSVAFTEFVMTSLQVIAALFIFAMGLLVLWVVVSYVLDVTQTQQAIRRNYPVIGRFRYLFEHMGEFFRQYFFAMDREELPFNRAQRSWVYRAAKNVDSTVAFGSTDNISGTGRTLFVNCTFPTLGEDAVPARPVTIGPHCKYPYVTASIFNISGMSFGAISKPAVLALSAGAKAAGCWMNTGEGGLSPYHLEGGADIVFQIGTAKNGVRDLEGKLNDDKLIEVAAHPEVKMFEIKMSQGAKPGKGGILPGEKITAEISAIRGVEIGEDAISPNRHVDITSFDDLLDMINRIRDVTGKPVGFKMVVGAPFQIDDLLKTIIKRDVTAAPDFITVDGAEGGTGAAPMALIDSVGMSLRESLPIMVDKLKQYGLRERVKVIASGKLVTPSSVAWALCSGADFIVSARGFMFSLGCIQALQCNKNTCPTGITTHDIKLQRGLNPQAKSVRVTSYVNNMVKEVGIIAHSCGVKNPRALNRTHARVVVGSGRTIGLDELFPEPESLVK